MNEIMNIEGIECYEKDGTAYLKLETVARGLGFTQTQNKNGTEYISVRWERVEQYLEELGFPHLWGKDDFIPENIFYRLAMKAKNAVAEAFQAKIADEVIPAIRRHGIYATAETAERLMNDPDFMIRTFTALKEEREKRMALESQAELDRPKVEFANAAYETKAKTFRVWSAWSLNAMANLLTIFALISTYNSVADRQRSYKSISHLV